VTTDTHALQVLVGAKPDGDFGPFTKIQTIRFLKLLVGDEVWANLKMGRPVDWKKAALIGLGGAATIGAGLILTKKDAREKVVAAALGELGVQNPDKYWSIVQPKLMGRPTEIAWCGGFALWALKQASLAKDMIWNVGLGFAEVYHLPKTKDPKPGDIAYYDQPFQHHALVKRNNGDGTMDTIDGNQTGETVKEKFNVPISKPTAIYSIQPLVDAA